MYTIALSLFVVALGFAPESLELGLEVAPGQSPAIFNWLTGHFVHWNTEHLIWDLAVFVVFGLILERHSVWLFLAAVLFSAAAISTSLLLFPPDFSIYKGLSGVDSALYVAVLMMEYHKANPRVRWVRPACAIGLGGFGAKLMYEVILGQTVFVSNLGTGVVPVPSAHLVGGIVGGLAVLFYWLAKKPRHPMNSEAGLPA